MVSTSALAELYEEEPWLVKAVGSLGAFCEKSIMLEYLPRGPRSSAMVSCANRRTDTEEDGYKPRWMSRVTLMQQRPSGFKMRSRADRRAQTQKWAQGLLDAFWPEAAGQADALMTATRRWPQNDAQRCNVEAAAALPPSSSHLTCKVVLRNIYKLTVPVVSNLDHSSRCSYVQHSIPAPQKALPGEPPVPRSMWRGSCPAKQRALFRHFRGLGWGPHKRKGPCKRKGHCDDGDLRGCGVALGDHRACRNCRLPSLSFAYLA